MGSRLAIYTCVTGGYDVVLPPLVRVPDADFLLFTDRPDRTVRGWRTCPLISPAGLTPGQANRYHKILPHKVLGAGYDVSIYVDGNIRLLRDPGPLLDEMREGGTTLGLFPHEFGRNIDEEAAVCVERGKASPAALEHELAAYRAEGFPDDTGPISENGVLFRVHNAPRLRHAMEDWRNLTMRHSGRDQISLPYVIWKHGLAPHDFGFSYREGNPWFHLYSHWLDASGRADWRRRLKVMAHARRPQGLVFRLLARGARHL